MGSADVGDDALGWSGDGALEGAPCLLLQVGPCDGGDRREFAVQVVHRAVLPFSSPIPRESSGRLWTSGAGSASATVPPGGSGGSSRKSAVGTKNRVPVTAVEKSRIRSWLASSSPRNIRSSIRSVTVGVRA